MNNAVFAQRLVNWFESNPWHDKDVLHWGFDLVEEKPFIQMTNDAFDTVCRRYSVIPRQYHTNDDWKIMVLDIGCLIFKTAVNPYGLVSSNEPGAVPIKPGNG